MEGPECVGCVDPGVVVSVNELLHIIPFYNSLEGGGEGEWPADVQTADRNQNNAISLAALVRVIQFYNSLGYHYCPGEGTEDGFCPGL